MTALTRLYLIGLDWVTNNEGVPFLSDLSLSGCCKIADKALKELRRFSTLTSLNLGDRKKITDAGLKNLWRPSSPIASLNLQQGCNITDTGLKEINCMSALTALELSSEKADVMGMKDLTHVSTLAYLDLSKCPIADFGRKELGHMSALTLLNLKYCTRITDTRIMNLKQLAVPTSLDLPCCPNITDAGRKELMEHLPNLSTCSPSATMVAEVWPNEKICH